MYVISVIPISRGIAKEELSYFSSREVKEGSVVSVPLRSKKASAIVSKVTRAEDIKSEIRKAGYQLKKIDKVSSVKLLLPEFVEAARESAEYFATTTGAVLNSVIPKTILDSLSKIKVPASQEKSGDAHEKFIFQAEDEERMARYKGIIRELFAKNASVFILAPTITYAETLFKSLCKGVEQRTYLLHGGLSKPSIIASWKKAMSNKKPVLIIATTSFLSIPRNDIGAIIVEREHSRFYKNTARPFLDGRIFAEILSRRLGAKLIFGDVLLRIESLWRFRNFELLEVARPKLRYLASAETKVVDMKKLKTPSGSDFRVLSSDIDDLISKIEKTHGHMFIFAVRRGLSPVTICKDCGHVVTCEVCYSPMVLHKQSNSRSGVFICHKCGGSGDTKTRCKNCNSWNLVPYGIGVDLISDTIRQNHPDIEVFELDSDKVKSAKKAAEVIKKWTNSSRGILVGTEMALPHLPQIEFSAVASIDSLFSVPDFRINEKIFNILLTIRSMTEKRLIVQTRNKDKDTINYAAEGNVADFYRKEIKERELLEFPPFSVLIKIAVKGKKPAVEKNIRFIKSILKEYPVDYFPASSPSARDYQMNALITLPRGAWLDPTLLEKLRALPPFISVDVCPEGAI